jgi:GT2 family glycosyltransferase
LVPSISIVVIFLNPGRFLREAVESVLAQSYAEWELILVDDGSTDGSTELAQSYAARYPDRIRWVEFPEHANRGMSAARNLGVQVARGEFISFLDADDVYLPDRLQRHVKVIEEHPGVELIQGCHRYWHSWTSEAVVPDEDEVPPFGAHRGFVAPGVPVTLLLRSQLATIPLLGSITVRRRAILDVGGSDESFRSHFEDQVLLCRLWARVPTFVLPEIGCWYRQHAASATGGVNAPINEQARIRFLNWLAAFAAAEPTLDSTISEQAKDLMRPSSQITDTLGGLRGAAVDLLRRVVRSCLPARYANALQQAWYEKRQRQHRARIARAREGLI